MLLQTRAKMWRIVLRLYDISVLRQTNKMFHSLCVTSCCAGCKNFPIHHSLRLWILLHCFYTHRWARVEGSTALFQNHAARHSMIYSTADARHAFRRQKFVNGSRFSLFSVRQVPRLVIHSNTFASARIAAREDLSVRNCSHCTKEAYHESDFFDFCKLSVTYRIELVPSPILSFCVIQSHVKKLWQK